MSEADIPGYEAGLPEVADLSNAAESPEVGDEGATQAVDEWQTVDFPNPIGVNELGQAVGDIEPNPGGMFVPIASPDLVYLVQELQQHNHTLQNRVTQLETTIALGQNALQVEVEKTQQQETLLVQRHQELNAAQTHINHLFQELESFQATAQRQQILIETLTAQLESSQERIAQLERDCALTQQRHHEQVQLLMQAENTCRDLQSRLHRQQRHTLQFKAALEKCLEMPSVAQHYANVPETLVEPASAKRNTKTIAIQIFAPKTQPVQPWSTQSQGLEFEADADGREGEGSAIDPAPQSKEEQHSKREWHILQALGATAVSDAPPPIVEPTEESGIDPQPAVDTTAEPTIAVPCPPEKAELSVPDLAFLDTLDQQALFENLPLLAPELERQIDRIVQSFMSEPGSSDDALWEDLARLIGLPLEPGEVAQPVAIDPNAEAETVPLPEIASGAEEDIEASSPLLECSSGDSVAESEPTEATEPAEPLGEVVHLFRSLRQLERQPEAPSLQTNSEAVDPNQSSRFFTVAATLATETPAEVETTDDRPASQDPLLFQSAGPSPVVYPLRSSKKLKSLAAVQLPSFPRLQSVKG